MDEKNTNLQADDTLAVLDPESYVLSNPTPRDWNMTAQDIARSLKVTPYESVTTKAQREGDQLNIAETIGTGIWDALKRLPKSISETIAVANIESYSSPNMTEKEAARLLQDALYTRHFSRKAEDTLTADKIKYDTLYNISGAVGDLIKYAGIGIMGGLPAVTAVAGAEAYSETEAAMVDSYIDKKGTIEGYEKKRGEDVALAGAYGVFSGLTETALGVERIAAGALNRYGRMEAAARLARQKGQLYKSAALRAGRRFGMSALEEGTEEFVQQIGEDTAKYWAGYEDAVFTEENFKKAVTAAAYGALIGGPAGWGLYRINRQSLINKINDWNNNRKLGMTEQQVIESADQILDESKTAMLDEIATRAEIKNGYGEAFDTVKARIAELIDATGTTPWTDQNKTKEQYVEDAAKAVTLPAIIQANKAQLPLSDFLEVADLNVTDTSSGKAPILNFVPIATIDDLQRMLDEQNAIIKEENDAAKIGNANPERKQAAQRRKAILQYHIRAKQLENGMQNVRRTRRKEQADYVTAKDLQPEQTATLDTAMQAEEGQDYVLFAGKRIPVEYQVVELSTIQPSHINGTPNPLYTNTALQNRASRGTTQDVADLREKATNITPERLLRATTSAEGAPVVNERGEVIAGNGRAEIVRYAYENPESAEKYKTALANAGFNIEGMERPILVRKNTTMTDSEQVAAADISNISETSAFDEASQARRDTQYLKDSATPIDFASKLPMSERRGLMQNNGRWNKRRVQQRYEDALLSWLTGNDTQLFENLVLDRGISQKVIDILTSNGAQIYELATKYPELGIREDLYHALQKMQMATRDNFVEITQQVELDGRDVMPENIFIWNWLFTDGTTNRQFMSNYLSTIQKNAEAVNAGQDMFGDTVAPLSKKDALMQALKKTDEARAQTAAERGREYEGLFTQETEEVKNPELAAAISSYNNQFAMQGKTTLSQLAYISGTTFYNRPSTQYVLRGGEGQIVHGWGIYALKDKEKNKARYRERQFSGKYVFVPNMPKYQQLIKGAKNQKESQIFKMVLDTIAGRTPINMYKQIGFAGGISSYVPIFYLDALYEVMGKNANKTDKEFLEKVITKGQLADESIFKVDPKMSKWLQRAILQTLDMHNDLKNSKFYQKDLPYIFVNSLTLNEVQSDFLDFIKKEFKHKDLNERANKALSDAIITYVPEDDVLLNEDLTLKSQPAAAKLREIITDWHWDFSRELIHNIRESSWIKKHLDSDWKIFSAKHGLNQDESIDDFIERLFNEHMENFDQTMTKERELFVDYIMETMHGEGLYNALADIIPETYIELESGEEIGEDKDYDGKDYTVMGARMPAELARDVALYLNDQGIKGIKYRGGIDEDGFVIFSDEAIQTLRRIDDDLPMYYQRRGQPLGFYDPELQAIVLGKNWNETTLIHEFHHRYLEKIWGIYKQATAGVKTVAPAFMEDTQKLFEMLEIDPKQDQLTAVQQEKFASMVEAYLTGLGVDNADNLAFKAFLHWIPEKYKSVMDIGYLDEQGNIQNPFLDQESIDFFDKWFASPFAPSLPSSPQAQRLVNVTDDRDEIIPSTQKVMNNREKEWGQDSEEQNKADAQLWRAIGENNPSDIRAAMDGEQELMKAEAKKMEDDRILPEKPKLRDKWFKARQPDARELAAEKARAYLEKNPEHARELAFADPETLADFDAPVDQGMLIRAVMETVPHGSDEWYILDNNLAMVKSMSGSTLSLSGDLSHQAYLDAKREVEAAREMKAAVNYAGTREGAMEKWNSDIRAFTAKRVAAIIATEPNSQERKVAIEAFLEEAKTKFSGNTTNAILNQLDLTGMKTKNSQAFIKWAENQIKQAAHAKIDTKEQAELMKASVKAQLALRDINSTEQKDGKFARAVQSAKDIRHWQFVKDKMKKAYIGRWGKFGIWVDNLFGGYMPSAMLMSVNTLFFANVPSTAINTVVVRASATAIGKNAVNEQVQKDEVKRITQIFNGSGINLAQMEKPTSPSLLHGEKYTNQEQAHWYNFTFEILGRTDNLFRIPTFVDTLARIATKNANGDSAKATVLFKEYIKLGNTNEDAQMARKQALAVANMAVFTQDGTMASALNHIRSQLNTMSRGLMGLEPGGFGLGNVLAPFLKTGANIVEMGLKATAAPIRQLIQWGKQAQGKQIPDVDKLAMRVDWTYFAFTAVVTALMAAITSDDDEWYIEPYKPGMRYDPNRPYDSIKVAGTWVKLDIFGPLEVPLRTAAMLVKDWDEKQMAAVGGGLMEALGETPLVNQFMDNSMEYAAKQPGKWASSFAYNQINKLIPAQAKSITRAGSRATGAELDVSALGKTIERKFHRNYGLDGEQLTTNDLINLLTNRLKTNPE